MTSVSLFLRHPWGFWWNWMDGIGGKTFRMCEQIFLILPICLGACQSLRKIVTLLKSLYAIHFTIKYALSIQVSVPCIVIFKVILQLPFIKSESKQDICSDYFSMIYLWFWSLLHIVDLELFRMHPRTWNLWPKSTMKMRKASLFYSTSSQVARCPLHILYTCTHTTEPGCSLLR